MVGSGSHSTVTSYFAVLYAIKACTLKVGNSNHWYDDYYEVIDTSGGVLNNSN